MIYTQALLKSTTRSNSTISRPNYNAHPRNLLRPKNGVANPPQVRVAAQKVEKLVIIAQKVENRALVARKIDKIPEIAAKIAEQVEKLRQKVTNVRENRPHRKKVAVIPKNRRNLQIPPPTAL